MKNRRYGERERKARSQPVEEVWGCPSGKIGYATRSRAKRAAKDANRHGQRVEAVYGCPLCPAFHLTSQPQNPAARARP
jgi:hypothetical protein